MMKFSGRQKGGKGGKSGLIMSRDRGRYLRPVVPKPGEPVRVAIDATLREAAKNQIWRKKEALAAGKPTNRIFLEPSDVRAKLMARKAGSLLIFCVDASGSMALNRMTAAKGAACGLLTEAYQSRDKICLIPFQGKSAKVLFHYAYFFFLWRDICILIYALLAYLYLYMYYLYIFVRTYIFKCTYFTHYFTHYSTHYITQARVLKFSFPLPARYLWQRRG
jgi:hypothetical protein